MMLRKRWFFVALLAVGCGARSCAPASTSDSVPQQFIIPKVSSTSLYDSAPRVGPADAMELKQGTEELTWTFEPAALGRIDVVVVLPDRHAGENFRC